MGPDRDRARPSGPNDLGSWNVMGDVQMADVTIDLLKTYFRQLRLPTMGAEFERLARDAAATNQTFVQFLLRLTAMRACLRLSASSRVVIASLTRKPWR